MNVGVGLERLIYFILSFLLLLHLVACLWLIIGVYQYGVEDSWVDDDLYASDHYDQYVISFYWAVTTITTVGYGDISANNNLERVFGTLIMLIGVLCFSFASGSLASILGSMDV